MTMSQLKRKTSADAEPTDKAAQQKSQPSTTANKMQRLQHHACDPNKGDSYYRSLYQTEPNFRQLAKVDAAFASKLENRQCLDFTDPSSVLQLTKTLLSLDFGLDIELPGNRLCPPIPNRHNYILWLRHLMATASYAPADRPISGLDIGTGASCIYPLLACTQRDNWSFLATDIDAESLKYARANVEKNSLTNRITVMARKPTQDLIPLGEDDCDVRTLDFVMTNPPFYSSESDMLASAAKKGRPPHSACTGAPVEMVCEGGEVAFVERILAESLRLREKVGWYTSMLGKASSLEKVVERLRGEEVDNYAVTEFVQGNKTRRWAVGWSFRAMRPEQGVARGVLGPGWKKILPEMTEELTCLSRTDGVGKLGERVNEIGHGLELLFWEWDKEKLVGIGRARRNVWGRAWRRRKLREQKEGVLTDGQRDGADAEEVCALGFQIRVVVGGDEAKTTCRWVEGHDPAIFQSLCGYLKGQLGKTA